MITFKELQEKSNLNESLLSEYGKDIKWISKITDKSDWKKKLHRLGEYYTKDGQYLIRVWDRSINFTDISEAFKSGKKANHFVFLGDSTEFVNLIPSDAKYKNITQLLFIMSELGVDIKKESKRSIDLFNPSLLGKLKKVSKLPSRINRMHLIKIIANGQYTILRQDYKYTDDYASDSANNFSKNNNLNPVNEIQRIMRMNNVLYMNTNKDGFIEINYGAHSNDGKTCVTALKG